MSLQDFEKTLNKYGKRAKPTVETEAAFQVRICLLLRHAREKIDPAATYDLAEIADLVKMLFNEETTHLVYDIHHRKLRDRSAWILDFPPYKVQFTTHKSITGNLVVVYTTIP